MIIHFRDFGTNADTVTIEETMDLHTLLKDDPEIRESEPLTVKLTASYVAGTIHIQGKLQAKLGLICARCLTHFDREFDVRFDELFARKDEILIESDSDDDEDDDTIQWISTEEFKLQPYIEEAFMLEIPYAPICSDDCKGLCSLCGQDLNEQACSCEHDTIDPRLEKLKDFFK